MLMIHAPAGGAADDIESIDGFRIDARSVGADRRSALHQSLVDQVHIVQSVGLSPQLLNFFQRVDVVVDPELRAMPGQYAHVDGRWVVKLQARPMPGNRPILLHELLHAYHHQVLTIGNKAIEASYQRARATGAYPGNFQAAHFLENSREYFAVIGSIYLFGRIQQPPFECAVAARTDPEFLSFLAEQFGPHDCH